MHLPGTRPLWGEGGGVGSFLSHHLHCAPGWPQHSVHEGDPSSLMPGTAGGLALEPLLSTALFPHLLLGSPFRELGRELGGVLSIPASLSQTLPPPTTPFRSRPLRPRPSARPERGRGKGRVISISGRLLGGFPARGGAASGAQVASLLTAFRGSGFRD